MGWHVVHGRAPIAEQARICHASDHRHVREDQDDAISGG